MSKTLEMPLRGIIPPMVTPLLGRDELDVPGLERLVDHLLNARVHGIFILGTTGEAPSLSHRLRYELIERVCELAAGSVVILVGITDTSFTESVNTAEKAAQCGADAVVMAPPYYFPADQPELLEYVRHLVPEIDLPLFLYNMPYAKPAFDPETVRIAAGIDGIVGLKDSSADRAYFQKVREAVRDFEDFSLLMGPERLLAEAIMLGAHGGVCGAANVVPKLYMSLYEAASNRDMRTLEELNRRAMAINERIYGVGQFRSSYLKGIKCSLACMGICSDFMAEPFHRFRDVERDVIRGHLRELGLMD